MGLRITTWNVNGIRNPFSYQPWRDNRSFDAMFDILEADIVLMQELKIQRKDLRDDMVLVPGWDCYFSLPRHKKGYSGVGIYTRQAVCSPIRAEEGVLGVLCPPGSEIPYCDMADNIGGYLSMSQMADLEVNPTELDAEGRCVVLEFPAFVLFGIYSPANSSGLRDDFRRGFQLALDTRIRNLVALGKRVVVCGDLNVSREEIDTANAEETKRKEGISHEEYVSTPNRRLFNQLIEGGVVFGDRDREKPVMWDVCRGFHPTRAGMFTHWEQKINARPGNYGSRIDFILCSLDMKSWFCQSDIQEGLLGSDHCPVFAVLNDKVSVANGTSFLRDLMNPNGVFKHGLRVDECSTQAIPAFSARLMPEFHRRRNIRDMFGAQSSADKLTSTESPQSTDRVPQSPVSPILSSSAASASQKRSAPSLSPVKPSKKVRAATVGPGKGQQSLKGFFKPHSSKQTADDASEQGSYGSQTLKAPNESLAGEKDEQAASTDRDTLDEEDEEPFIDPDASRQNWSRLFNRPAAPRCEHGEACKVMKTKKAGFNCGREFWMCQRPLGPSGSKERNSEWRCPTFIWSSDWTGN